MSSNSSSKEEEGSSSDERNPEEMKKEEIVKEDQERKDKESSPKESELESNSTLSNPNKTKYDDDDDDDDKKEEEKDDDDDDDEEEKKEESSKKDEDSNHSKVQPTQSSSSEDEEEIERRRKEKERKKLKKEKKRLKKEKKLKKNTSSEKKKSSEEADNGVELKEVVVSSDGSSSKEKTKAEEEASSAASTTGPLSTSALIAQFGTNVKTGLTVKQVEQMRLEHGFNEAPEKKVNPYLRFLKKFWGPTPWILEATVIVSYAGLRNWVDGSVILALLLLNAILGFVQEMKASKAVEALKLKLQVIARVLRDGNWTTVPSRELVPGDVVRVRIGDFVPADIQTIHGLIEVDQSALTGESEMIHKDVGSVVYSGSIVKMGECLAIVTSTGTRTFFGKTVQLVSTSAPRLHIESVIAKVIGALMVMVITMLVIAIIVLAVDKDNLLQVVPLLLILLVSAVPVALPAMFTVTMAYGSVQLVDQGVLITRLSATEDAASMSVLCSDKTGTITRNQLDVVELVPCGDFSKEILLRNGVLCSKEENQDAIDLAFISAYREMIGKDKTTEAKADAFTELHFQPFDPKTRRTEAILQLPNHSDEIAVTKGAVASLLELCNAPEELRASLSEKVSAFATKGHRSIGVACSAPCSSSLSKEEKEEHHKHFQMVGIVSMSDTPRKESKAVIQQLKALGIRVKMLTGDALPIAKQIAQEVDLGPVIFPLHEMKSSGKDSQSDNHAAEENKEEEPEEKSNGKGKHKKTTKKEKLAPDLDVDVDSADGFAEIYPEDKHTIVRMLQKKHYIVGMTGDGVNDAPALKQAEVGIAVSNATDVAKGAASAVLTREGLGAVIDLVKVGRMIHQRIVTWILNKIVKTFQTVVFVVLAFLVRREFIVRAFDILLLLFLVDFVTLSLATDNARWSNTPEKWQVLHLVRVAVSLGLMVVGESFGLLYVGLYYLGLDGDINSLNTFIFSALFFFGLFTVYVVRERSWAISSWPSKMLIIVGIVDSILVLLLCSFGLGSELYPIPIQKTLVSLAWAVGSSIINDFVKVFLFRLFL